MGERRFRAAKKAVFKEIPAVVRKMDDKSLRLYSIVENLHRQKLASKEEEDAIYEIWKRDYEPNGKSKPEMAKELGKSSHYVADKISGYELRKGFKLRPAENSQVTTHNLVRVKSLDEDLGKRLVQARAEGVIDKTDLNRHVPILHEAPEEKREEIMEGVLESKPHIEEYEADVGEVAEDIAKNESDVITKLDKSADQKRLSNPPFPLVLLLGLRKRRNPGCQVLHRASHFNPSFIPVSHIPLLSLSVGFVLHDFCHGPNPTISSY